VVADHEHEKAIRMTNDRSLMALCSISVTP